MKTVKEIKDLLAQCEYSGPDHMPWNFRLEERTNGDLLLQVRFMGHDRDEKGMNQLVQMSGRKWFISRHATRTEIVQTAWLAVLKAVEHEAREAFLYRGQPVFNTHIDVDTLAADAGDVDLRETPLEGAS